MSFFETVVFSDIMQIIAPNNDCSLHFHFDDNTAKDSASNQNIASERTFFINVSAFSGLQQTGRKGKKSLASNAHNYGKIKNGKQKITQRFRKLTSRGVLKPKPTFLT